MADDRKEPVREPQTEAASESKSAADIPGESRSKLPDVEAPPLSPVNATVSELPAQQKPDAAAAAEKTQPIIAWISALPRWPLKRRQKRQAMLAASFALAAAIGGVLGAYASSYWPAPKTPVTALNERKSLEHSIDQINKQVASLKADLDKTTKAALEHAKTEQTQIARLSERVGDITGALPPREPAPAQAVPMPRPAPRIAAAESRPSVLPDWSIYGARGGYIYVRGHGEIYQVVPGAPLPGLGPVQAIKRENGAWVVVTPKGLIVAGGDRSTLE